MIEAGAHRSRLLQLTQSLLQTSLIFQTDAKHVAGSGEMFRLGIITDHRAQHADRSFDVPDPMEAPARLQQRPIRKIAGGKELLKIGEHFGGIRKAAQVGQALPSLHLGFGDAQVVRVSHDEAFVSGQRLLHRAAPEVRLCR